MSRQAVLVLLLVAVTIAIFVVVLKRPSTDPSGVTKDAAQDKVQKTDPAQQRAADGAQPPLSVQAAKYTPPSVHNPALASFVNRESKEERVTGDIHVRLPKVDDPDDVKAVAGVLLDTKDDDTVRHEAANLLRRSNYPGLTADLLTVLHNAEEKERFRSFVTQHLWSQAENASGDERAQIMSELRGGLSDRHTAVRREALLALVRLDDPAGTETALKWFAEAKPETEGVLDLCIRVIRERDLRENLPAVRKLIASANDDAARQAMVTVGQWGDQGSRPLLEEASKSPRPLVKRAADAALKKLDVAKASPTQPIIKEGAGGKPDGPPPDNTRF